MTSAYLFYLRSVNCPFSSFGSHAIRVFSCSKRLVTVRVQSTLHLRLAVCEINGGRRDIVVYGEIL